MHERIKELAEQAEKLTDIAHLDAVGYGKASDWHVIFCDKFAELIIKECASMVQDCVDRRVPSSEYPDHLEQLLRKKL